MQRKAPPMAATAAKRILIKGLILSVLPFVTQVFVQCFVTVFVFSLNAYLSSKDSQISHSKKGSPIGVCGLLSFSHLGNLTNSTEGHQKLKKDKN